MYQKFKPEESKMWWEDPYEKNWEHNRNFGDRAYGGECKYMTDYVPCEDFTGVNEGVCYVSFTLDTCGSNYCWIYRGKNKKNLNTYEDCLPAFQSTEFFSSMITEEREKFWTSSSDRQMLYDYWTWYHYYNGANYLKNSCIPMNGMSVWYEACEGNKTFPNLDKNSCILEKGYSWSCTD